MRSNDRSTSLWMVFFLALAVAIGGGRLWRTRQPGAIKPIAERKIMMPLTLRLLDGGEWKPADHSGQVMLINYWATWCEPCREELPGLIQLARDIDPQSVAIVGVSLDSGPNSEDMVRSFTKRFRVPYPIAMPDDAARRDLGEMGLPTTLLLDKHGRVARTWHGAVERADFAKDIATLLAEG